MTIVTIITIVVLTITTLLITVVILIHASETRYFSSEVKDGEELKSDKK